MICPFCGSTIYPSTHNDSCEIVYFCVICGDVKITVKKSNNLEERIGE